MAQFQGLVVGLSLLTGALTAWVVSCFVTKLRRRKAGEYMSLDPSVSQRGSVHFQKLFARHLIFSFWPPPERATKGSTISH